MPRSTGDFWKSAEDWSRRKHLILSYYLTPASPKLRTQSPDGRVYVLDGFAGRGQYEDGSHGSPIYMGELAEKCRNWSNPVALTIYNIEPDSDSFQDLENCTRKWTDLGYIINLQGTFQSQLPVVLTKVRRAPLFAFLDPFRPSHLNFQDIQPLLERTDITEVCIVFHTPAVMRVLNAVRPGSRIAGDRKAGLEASLDEVFGGRRWEALLASSIIRSDDVIACFAEQAKTHARWKNLFVCSHPIKARYQVGLKYHIIFLTRHPHGVQLMNDAFCKEAKDTYEQIASRQNPTLDLDFGEPLGPTIERTADQRISELKSSLIEIGQAHPDQVWRRENLRFDSMMRRFGEFTWSEHLKAIDALLTDTVPPKLVALDVVPKRTGRITTNENTSVSFQW